VVREGVEIPFPYVREIIDGLHLSKWAPLESNRALIAPYAADIEAWAERSLVPAIQAVGARPVAVYLPRPRGAGEDEVVDSLLQRAAKAGFETIDLRTVYAGYDVEDLAVAPWDGHPSVLAHRLVAERL